MQNNQVVITKKLLHVNEKKCRREEKKLNEGFHKPKERKKMKIST